MIQRVQTIYLILAALCGLIGFFVPYAHFYLGDVKMAEYAMFGVFQLQRDVVEMTGPFQFPAWVLGTLCTLIPLGAVFLYKNRPVQYRVVRLAFLSFLVYTVYLFFAIEAVAETAFSEIPRTLHHVGFYVNVAALPFCFLAVRGIKKDEALVKSLDRIR